MNYNNINIEFTYKGTVAEVILNRPEYHNAFNLDMIQELNEAFRSLDVQSNIRLVIIRAQGTSFCAGADLNWMKNTTVYSYEQNIEDARCLANMFKNLYFLSKPVVAIINGAAYGGGVGLAACADIVFATERAKFSFSEVKIGLIPAVISPFVIAAIGQRNALRYFMTAEIFEAKKAFQMGLVHELIDSANYNDQISIYIKMLLNNGPQALISSKSLVKTINKPLFEENIYDETIKEIARIRTSIEGQEGLTAFLEKRKPSWII